MIHLGLTSAEYGRMTPRQLYALWEAWRQRERTLDRRSALVAWLYAEAHRDHGKHRQPWIIENLVAKIHEADAEVDPAVASAATDANLTTQFAGAGLKAKEISAEEFQAILASRYTGPHGDQRE